MIIINKNNELMLCFITNNKIPAKEDIIVKELNTKFSSIISISHNKNKSTTPINPGDKIKNIYGK